MGSRDADRRLPDGLTNASTSPISPSKRITGPADVLVAKLDVQGRLRLGKLATAMGWAAQSTLTLAFENGVMRLGDATQFRDAHLGIHVLLDSRHRVQLPLGIRVALAVRPGARLIFLAAPDQGLVAAIPVRDLADRLTTGP